MATVTVSKLTARTLAAARLPGRARAPAQRCFTAQRVGLPAPRGVLVCQASIGCFYSTSTGHTEDVASLIKQEIGEDCSEPKDIGDIDLSTLSTYDGLIVGAPTWNTGADTERSGTSWDNLLDDIRGLSLDGTPVAVFGLGDSVSYGDNFADAMEEIYEVFKTAGGKMVGHWPTEGYQHTESKAQIDDNTFCGLPLDEDNEDDKSLERIKGWLQTIKGDMKF